MMSERKRQKVGQTKPSGPFPPPSIHAILSAVQVAAAVSGLIVIASTVWVGADASRRDWSHDKFADAAWKWVLGCLLLWIVVFPLYLARRNGKPAAGAAPSGRVTVIKRRNVPVFWWGIASAAAIALGAVGPWATVLGASISGIDRSSGDGWLVLILAAVALLCVLGQHRSSVLIVIGCLAGTGGLLVSVYDHYNIESAIDSAGIFGHVVAIGWGLNLAIAASLSTAIQALVAARATTKLHQWHATPAQRNVLVGPDGGFNIPYKSGAWNQSPATATREAETPLPTVPSPGWYVDPDDPQRLRYWNGEGWQKTTARLESDAATEAPSG
jgi:Protein of unknown function (DUF2510)